MTVHRLLNTGMRAHARTHTHVSTQKQPEGVPSRCPQACQGHHPSEAPLPPAWLVHTGSACSVLGSEGFRIHAVFPLSPYILKNTFIHYLTPW